jgi:hypothetical protein
LAHCTRRHSGIPQQYQSEVWTVGPPGPILSGGDTSAESLDHWPECT